MPILLRINHEKTDVIFQVITEKPSTQSQLEVFMGGKTYVFIKTNNSWMLSENQDLSDVNSTLMNAVAKALALRFRINSALHVI
ncbi:MAG TPA: hypothetical protein VL125_13450 [Pelobium sp.]|nr:hypothetical protein [Pelobium sp.]